MQHGSFNQLGHIAGPNFSKQRNREAVFQRVEASLAKGVDAGMGQLETPKEELPAAAQPSCQ